MIELIPAIDIIDGKCVRLTKGDYNQKTATTIHLPTWHDNLKTWDSNAYMWLTSMEQSRNI